MKFIDSQTIAQIASYDEWLDTIEKAMLMSVTGSFLMPKRMHLDHKDDTFLLMPCITDEYWATKLVSFCPGNNSKNLQSIYGTIVLCNSKTGEPLAILDGTCITAFRTAAVSALGIKYLAPKNSRSLGLIGTGVQGIYQARFACSVREIEKLTVFDRNADSLKNFVEVFSKDFPQIRLKAVSDASEVCTESQIIITATNSASPVFPEEKDLYAGKTFIGIGSYKPECREYPKTFFSLVDQIFTDTLHGLKESGDLIFPVQEKLIPESNIYSLAELINGKVALSAKQTRFYKTVGSAIFDLYAAKMIYEKSVG